MLVCFWLRSGILAAIDYNEAFSRAGGELISCFLRVKDAERNVIYLIRKVKNVIDNRLRKHLPFADAQQLDQIVNRVRVY